MSFDTAKAVAGRKPVSIVECDLDRCAFEYGKSYTNLLLQSQTFGNASWNSSSFPVTVTENAAAAPDGTITADLLDDSEAVNPSVIYQDITVTASIEKFTASVYLKKGTAEQSILNVFFVGATEVDVTIDWATKAVSGGGGNERIEEIANGWYRVSLVLQDLTAVFTTIRFRVWPISRTATDTGSVYAWGAQLVAGNMPGHYVVTTTASASDGCTAVDAKANLVTYSEQFQHADHTNVKVTQSTDVETAPDGTLTAEHMVTDAVSGQHYTTYIMTLISGSTVTASMYAKPGAVTKIAVAINDGTGNISELNIDLTAGKINSVVAGTGTIEAVKNGWYRITVTGTLSGTTCKPVLWALNGSYAKNYVGDGVSGVYVWGAQVVYGTYPGLYYKTEGSAFSGTVGAECYGTFGTCEVTTDFSKQLKTFRYMEQRANLPAGMSGIPCVVGKIKSAPTKIIPDKGLGWRASISVDLADFPHHDRGIDPYVKGRTYDAASQGTFWGKMLARDPYYNGRIIRTRTGYISDPFTLDDFEDRSYVIEKIDPITRGDRIKITAKDILKLADDKRAQVPAPSEGTLDADITDTDTTFTLEPAGEGANYPVSGTYRIGDEIGTYTRSGDVITLVTRGDWGTTAGSHRLDDVFQDCLTFSEANVVDIIYTLLRDYAGIDEQYIAYDGGKATPLGTNEQWDDEKADWLSLNNLTYIISKPTGVNTVLQEITEQNLLYIWWDEVAAKIKLKTIHPNLLNASPVTINDTSNIIADSLQSKDDPINRITQVWVYYDKIDFSEDNKPENFGSLKVYVNTDAENANGYADSRVKVIYADWLTTNNKGIVLTLAGRLALRYGSTPKKLSFSLDAKDEGNSVGDQLLLEADKIQSVTGAASTQQIEILQVKEAVPGHKYDYEAISFNYGGGLYAFIGPNTLLDYGSESAANKQAYAFMDPTGADNYKII